MMLVVSRVGALPKIIRGKTIDALRPGNAFAITVPPLISLMERGAAKNAGSRWTHRVVPELSKLFISQSLKPTDEHRLSAVHPPQPTARRRGCAKTKQFEQPSFPVGSQCVVTLQYHHSNLPPAIRRQKSGPKAAYHALNFTCRAGPGARRPDFLRHSA